MYLDVLDNVVIKGGNSQTFFILRVWGEPGQGWKESQVGAETLNPRPEQLDNLLKLSNRCLRTERAAVAMLEMRECRHAKHLYIPV